MTPRQRVLAALRHEEPDRIPFDLGSTPCTGIHRAAYANLRAALGLPAVEPVIMHQMQQLVWVDEDVHAALRTDARGVRPGPPGSWKLRISRDDRYAYYTDEWGVVRRQQKEGGYYFDLCGSPLAAAETVADVERYPFPSSTDEARFTGMRARAEAVRASGHALVLGGVVAGMLETGQALRGYETLYCDLAANLPMVEAICDRILELKLQYYDKALGLVGDLADVVQEGDDYGGQNGLLFSPALWRRLLKPRLATLFGTIKRRAPHVRILFHSCGSIRDILPDLIEVGVDALNPVQMTAARMDTRELKREFGEALTFWGGGADTQHVLPHGTAADVRAEVHRRVADLAAGGGFVFAAVHNVQADVPAANILAMRSALDD
jgi:uroporphyrinogen decarboxylase